MDTYWNKIQEALDDLMVVLGECPEAKTNPDLCGRLADLTKLRNEYKRELIERYENEKVECCRIIS